MSKASFINKYYYHAVLQKRGTTVSIHIFETKKGLMKYKIIEFNCLLWLAVYNITRQELQELKLLGEVTISMDEINKLKRGDF